MADSLTQILTNPIQLADQVITAASEASSVKQECADLKSKTEKLANLLRQAARASSDLYERPTRRIVEDTVQVLSKALTLALKCRSNGFKRVFAINQAGALRKLSAQLENSIGDVSWLLRVSAPAVDRGDLGLPPIAANEPSLGFIWEQIAILHTGSVEDRSDAANSLASMARDNYHFGKLIVEEGGIGPLLKLVKDGKPEGQENAVRAIGLLGRDSENVEQMIVSGVCMVFCKVLKEGTMKVQAAVAWAVAELAGSYPKCQELFAQNNIIRLLVSHLAFETVEEHSKYAIASKNPSIHAVVVASKRNGEADAKSHVPHPVGSNQIPKHMHNVVSNTMAMKSEKQGESQKNGNFKNHNQQQSSGPGGYSANRARESEDPTVKSHMKAMAAKALCCLAKGNVPICRTITESRALLCFAVLLEKGSEDVQYNSAMALMEITAVAEQDTDLRRSAFRPNAPACKAVVDQLLKIIDKGDSVLLIPCIQAIGNLARTFRASETRIISPLVQLLDSGDDNISLESVNALTKFSCSANHLHLDHSKAILSAGATKHLVQLVYLGGQAVQTPALILLCYIALHVPDNEELAKNEVLNILERAERAERSKHPNSSHNETVEKLLPLAKSKLELYQSRGIH
uniref:DUF7792 domain-containing protein n=1 Tax=Kalanchoe fedtschenkoi TaxID=63787 RepID=A0A7N0UD13_KALFE